MNFFGIKYFPDLKSMKVETGEFSLFDCFLSGWWPSIWIVDFHLFFPTDFCETQSHSVHWLSSSIFLCPSVRMVIFLHGHSGPGHVGHGSKFVFFKSQYQKYWKVSSEKYPRIPGFGKIPSRKILGLKFLIPLGPDGDIPSWTWRSWTWWT